MKTGKINCPDSLKSLESLESLMNALSGTMNDTDLGPYNTLQGAPSW
jgi:hypothetical protein